MQHYGGLTAKRHLGISNAETVGDFDFGKICKSIRKKLASSSAKSAKTYRTKSGKKAFSGSKFLKSTGWGAEFKRMLLMFQKSERILFLGPPTLMTPCRSGRIHLASESTFDDCTLDSSRNVKYIGICLRRS